jgi:hypothetical protein
MDWTFVGDTIAALALAGSVLGFALNRIDAVRKAATDRIDKEVEKLEHRVDNESGERKRDIFRVDGELTAIAEIRSSLAGIDRTVAAAFEKMTAGTLLVGQQVTSLADRFGDFKSSTDRSSDEIKHSVRNLQVGVQGLALQQAKTGRGTEEPK